jgi:hypothetical protein
MATIGLIGSESIGATVARLSVAAGFDVVLSNSRGPQTLTDLVQELGPRALSGSHPHQRGHHDGASSRGMADAALRLTLPFTRADASGCGSCDSPCIPLPHVPTVTKPGYGMRASHACPGTGA